MTTGSDNVKELISLLQGLDASGVFEVTIPSLEREVKFKQLTTEQLKRLLKTIIDSPIYNTEFTITFNSIIKENCAEGDVRVDDLTVIDKLLIFFKTRIESISPEYTFNFTEEEIGENNLDEKTKTVNIQQHFNSFCNTLKNLPSETINYNNCTIVCNLPTIATENRLEKELHKNVKIEVTSTDELRNIVGETFINELTKFITSVSINDTAVDLVSLDFKTRIKVIENLPTAAINGVIKYIEKYRNTIKDLTTYKLSVKTKEQTDTSLVKDIPVDASFFNM
jgi:hypothetical protein